MKHVFVINNYTLGAKLRSAPTHKIVCQERTDKSHTKVVFDGLTKNEFDFCIKLFAKKPVEILD